jgi:hypothetical protein
MTQTRDSLTVSTAFWVMADSLAMSLADARHFSDLDQHRWFHTQSYPYVLLDDKHVKFHRKPPRAFQFQIPNSMRTNSPFSAISKPSWLTTVFTVHIPRRLIIDTCHLWLRLLIFLMKKACLIFYWAFQYWPVTSARGSGRKGCPHRTYLDKLQDQSPHKRRQSLPMHH